MCLYSFVYDVFLNFFQFFYPSTFLFFSYFHCLSGHSCLGYRLLCAPATLAYRHSRDTSGCGVCNQWPFPTMKGVSERRVVRLCMILPYGAHFLLLRSLRKPKNLSLIFFLSQNIFCSKKSNFSIRQYLREKWAVFVAGV